MFVHRVPAPPLSDHIAILWLYESYDPGHARERLLPSGSMELIVDLRNEQTILVGAHSQPSLLDTSQTMSVLGAHFRPGGAGAFLNLPADELHNIEVDLSDIWTEEEAQALRERLLAAREPNAKIHILERALLARWKRPRNPFVTFAIEQFRRAQTVKAVTDQIGVSQRTFINTFAREVGMTPKLYCRVRRFQRALRRVHRRDDVDWTDVALACGYFDQPHFNRNFRAFAGMSPTEYLAARTEHLNHVPV